MNRQLYFAGFARLEGDRHRYLLAFYFIVQFAADFSVTCIFNFCADMQNGRLLVGGIGPAFAGYFRYNMRVFDPDRTSMFDRHLIPDARISVADGLYPVPAGYILVSDVMGYFPVAALAAVGITRRIGRIDEDGQPVQAFGGEKGRYIIGLPEIHAKMSAGIQLVSVQPDITAVIHSPEVQPNLSV